MDTVSKLSRYAAQTGSDIRILGEPKTIDNDLIHTDHTPGFGSAARYVASTVREITIDANVYEKKLPANIQETTLFSSTFRKQPLTRKNFLKQ